MNAEGAPKGAPQAATAKQLARQHFIASKYTGKVRPAPREPKITHYGCSCCRWSA